MSGILWVASGAMGLVLAKHGVISGLHMCVPAIGQTISTFTALLARCSLRSTHAQLPQ
jgi:hypothetical protein